MSSPAPPQELAAAMNGFVRATERLEKEFSLLQGRVEALRAELEEKNRQLSASRARERRLEEEQARQSRLAAMGEMAASLAHEIRNPLGSMELFTSLLVQDLDDRPEARRLVRHIAEGIRTLNHLITNMLEFTRTRQPRLAPLDPARLLKEVLRYAAPLLREARVTVGWVDDGACGEVQADADLLRQVFWNLVRNAVQAMNDGGQLRVGCRANAARVAITFSDDGAGIPPERREAIFEPFYTTKEQGTGLGLAVVRSIVLAHGGAIRVSSRLGGGTTFVIELPRNGLSADNGAAGADAARGPSLISFR